MVFIWGYKGHADALGYVIWECPSCGTNGVFSVLQTRKKLTVYFVPTFSFSQKQFLVCTACEATFEVPKQLKTEIAENLMSQQELSFLIGKMTEETAELGSGVQTTSRALLLGDSDQVQPAEKNLVRDPSSARLHLTRALDCEAKGHYSEAIAEYTMAIALDDQYDLAYFSRGSLFGLQGKKADAIADFGRVIDLSQSADLCRMAKHHIERLSGEYKLEE